MDIEDTQVDTKHVYLIMNKRKLKHRLQDVSTWHSCLILRKHLEWMESLAGEFSYSEWSSNEL